MIETEYQPAAMKSGQRKAEEIINAACDPLSTGKLGRYRSR
jgi:hypothetical protein